MSAFEQYVLWIALPYASLLLLGAGLVWRYRNDQFGWTSRSSQWNESRILRWSSPLFHLGILLVAAGHGMGLGVPKAWTEAAGIPEHIYHLMAVVPGTLAGVMTLTGLGGLLYRRIVIKSVRLATTTNDRIMYVLLLVPICLGAWATVSTQLLGGLHGGYDYRETISPWFRSILLLNPRPELMADVPTAFKLQHRGRPAALRHLALHPAGPRRERAPGLRDPTLRRLPLADGRDGDHRSAPRMGARAHPGHRQPGLRRRRPLARGLTPPRTPPPRRDRSGSAPRSVQFRIEIGPVPYRDRSSSGSRSVQFRLEIGPATPSSVGRCEPPQSSGTQHHGLLPPPAPCDPGPTSRHP